MRRFIKLQAEKEDAAQFSRRLQAAMEEMRLLQLQQDQALARIELELADKVSEIERLKLEHRRRMENMKLETQQKRYLDAVMRL